MIKRSEWNGVDGWRGILGVGGDKRQTGVDVGECWLRDRYKITYLQEWAWNGERGVKDGLYCTSHY